MKKIYFIISVIFILFLCIFFLPTNSNSDLKKNKMGDSSYARGKFDSDSAAIKSRARQKSLFDEDSKFLEFPEIGIEDIDASSITSEEKERRRKIIIERSKKLAALFPHNSIIPRELNPEEAKKRAEANQRMLSVQNHFFQNEEVSKDDRLFYYNERLKTSKDRLEIFRYALGLQNEGVFDESKLDGILKERYDSFLESEKAYADEIVKVEKEK